MIESLFPVPFKVEHAQLRQQLEKAHFAWRIEWKRQQPDFVIENIRFEHDPKWNQRFWSVQSAHDLNHWAWKATAVVWASMGGSI